MFNTNPLKGVAYFDPNNHITEFLYALSKHPYYIEWFIYLQSVLDLVGDEDPAVLSHGVVGFNTATSGLQDVHVPLRLEPRTQVLRHNTHHSSDTQHNIVWGFKQCSRRKRKKTGTL